MKEMIMGKFFNISRGNFFVPLNPDLFESDRSTTPVHSAEHIERTSKIDGLLGRAALVNQITREGEIFNLGLPDGIDITKAELAAESAIAGIKDRPVPIEVDPNERIASFQSTSTKSLQEYQENN